MTSRLIDRPIRPLFPEGYFEEIQVIVSVLSYDKVNSPDTLAMVAASAALTVSDAPFSGPIAGVRVGRINGQLVINPAMELRDQLELEFIVAGTKDSIVMVEGSAKFVPENEVCDALFFAHTEAKKLIELQEQLQAKVGKKKIEVAPVAVTPLMEKVRALATDSMRDATGITGKAQRRATMAAVS